MIVKAFRCRCGSTRCVHGGIREGRDSRGRRTGRARHLVYLIADANLTTETIHLDHEIPNIVLKTSIPLDLLFGTYRTSKLRAPCFRIARRFGRHLQDHRLR
ncbi:hypothetical protein MES4922_180031 [Mesorhizobium ventifaucium]|uniref:Post-SET domain-containing protein n=1 Tax=Mesorhizobium ventifaucium TaxID=666020 RepID=A0ABN8JHA1_9HYPH|nr:hypothetical protein MES4922_180031 [Mesorhizobium ventifaucium]